MRLKILRFLVKLMRVEVIPFSEIVVTDNENGVIAIITPDEIVEHDGYHVTARRI